MDARTVGRREPNVLVDGENQSRSASEGTHRRRLLHFRDVVSRIGDCKWRCHGRGKLSSFVKESTMNTLSMEKNKNRNLC